ncbi:MAG: hypothetical protein JKY61_08360 [Planctomycetes bacterium]|nr:hypothetical protein [Planctomycetota bacterium]
MKPSLLTFALAATFCLTLVSAQSRHSSRNAACSSAASTFNLGDGAPEIGVLYCGAPAGARNTGELRAYGSVSVASNNVNLVVTGIPANSVGFFIVGEVRAFVPNPAQSQGDLCVGGRIGRFNGPGQIMNSGAGGFYNLQLDLNQFPMNPWRAVTAGETWCFQSWYRMPLPPVLDNSDSDFTNAIEIAFL